MRDSLQSRMFGAPRWRAGVMPLDGVDIRNPHELENLIGLLAPEAAT